MKNFRALKFFLLVAFTIISLYSRNAYLAFVLYFSLILWDKHFLIPVLLFIPAIETILLAAEGFTITRLLSLFIGLYMLLELVISKFRFDKNAFILIGFIVVSFIGVLHGGIYLTSGIFYGELSYFFIGVLPKLIFAVLFYLWVKAKSNEYIEHSFGYLLAVIPILLIVISIHFVLWGYSEINWYHLTRRTFEGADPNEFGGILSALSVIPLYVAMTDKKMVNRLISYAAVAVVILAITLTLSRSSLIVFSFMILITVIIVNRVKIKNIFIYTFPIALIIITLIQFAMIDVYSIEQRFFGDKVAYDIHSLTTNRSEFLQLSFKAFLEKPVFGHGNNQANIYEITHAARGTYSSLHNTYMEIAVRMGIAGFLIFLWILFQCFKPIFIHIHQELPKEKMVYLVPALSLMVICLAAFALSWQWREIFWFFIAMSMAMSKSIQKS